MGMTKMNKEKYSDPTAEQAIAHVMKEERKKKKYKKSNFDVISELVKKGNKQLLANFIVDIGESAFCWGYENTRKYLDEEVDESDFKGGDAL